MRHLIVKIDSLTNCVWGHLLEGPVFLAQVMLAGDNLDFVDSY